MPSAQIRIFLPLVYCNIFLACPSKLEHLVYFKRFLILSFVFEFCRISKFGKRLWTLGRHLYVLNEYIRPDFSHIAAKDLNSLSQEWWKASFEKEKKKKRKKGIGETGVNYYRREMSQFQISAEYWHTNSVIGWTCMIHVNYAAEK